MAIRVQEKPEDFGRCGCGRSDYCDGSHALSESQWQERQARKTAQQPNRDNLTKATHSPDQATQKT